MSKKERYEIKYYCKLYGIDKYTININGTIDVDGDVDMISKNLKYLPIRFNYVSGYFDVGMNGLETLYGCPKEVGNYFACNSNQLTSLKFAPMKVGEDFYCNYNQLTSLSYLPKKLSYVIYCGGNLITDLNEYDKIPSAIVKICFGLSDNDLSMEINYYRNKLINSILE